LVNIPDEIRELIESQGIFVVGSTSGGKFVNISPRVFFMVKEDGIYWLDFFKHKSYRNFTINPCVSIAVYDKETFDGYQLRGIVSFLPEGKVKDKIREEIIKETLKTIKSEKAKQLIKRDAEVILFEPKVIYSLVPTEFSDLSIGSDLDPNEIFCS